MTRQRRFFVVFPFTLLALGGLTALGAGCELAVDINTPFDGSPGSDVLDCGICADVSADANYDGPEVSIYGNPPGDAGVDATLRDAGSN